MGFATDEFVEYQSNNVVRGRSARDGGSIPVAGFGCCFGDVHFELGAFGTREGCVASGNYGSLQVVILASIYFEPVP